MGNNIVDFNKYLQSADVDNQIKRLKNLKLIKITNGVVYTNETLLGEWLDKRTINGEKITEEQAFDINNVFFLMFLVEINEPRIDNIDFLEIFLKRFGNAEFERFFEKQIAKSIYSYVNFKIQDTIEKYKKD